MPIRAVLCAALLLPAAASAQLDPLARPAPQANPLTTPTLSAGQLELIQLETDFAADVARNGGRAFAAWFADDGMELPNGKAPVQGLRAVKAMAQWDPETYQLTWMPDGAQMGPSGDAGFTWGHFAARSHDAQGQPVTREGRYITIWKKQAGRWKVALDASADDAPAGDCCSLPKP